MKNIYHHDIMNLLIAAGKEGMNVRQICRFIYNQHSGLFAQDVIYSRIYQQIRAYLWSQSKIRRSPFIWLYRGQYAIKTDVAVQLDFFINPPSEHHPQEQKKKSESIQLMFEF